MDITAKQRMFADEYIKTGNAKASYTKVYNSNAKVAEANSSRLLSNAKIQEYIKSMNKRIERSTIADMTEVKEFWTNMFRSKDVEPRDRLKASELIAKTNAAFIDKVISDNTNTNMNIDIDYDKFLQNATEEEKLNGDKLSGAEILAIINRT